MRIPLWLVIPLCMLFVAMLWWARIRNQIEKFDPTPVASQEFDPPPPPPVAADSPVTPPPVAIIEAPEPVAPVVEAPKIPVAGLAISPALNEYSEHSALGAEAMTELATTLEAGGSFQRALLAWERVLDSMEADETQRANACHAIARLRPTLPDWNADPKATVPLVLRVSTDASNKQSLATLLDELPNFIAIASSAIVAISVEVEYAKAKRPDPAVPAGIAIWFSPAGKNSPTSEVAAFTPQAATAEALRQGMLRAIFNIVAASTPKPARTPAPEGQPLDDLTHLITRFQWQTFATSLAAPAAN